MKNGNKSVRGFLALLAWGLAAAAASAYDVTVDSNVPYGPLPEEVLDVCRPKGVSGPLPAFVVIHGGGWWQGDKSLPPQGTLTANVCRRIASMGYVAFNIDYRLVQNDATTFPNPDAVNAFPAPLVDAQLAVRWVRKHAEDYGIDPGHVCSWGDSAGGDLAVFLGVLAEPFTGDEAGLYADESPAVNCVVSHSGAVDFTLIAQGIVNETNGNLPTLQYVNSASYADLQAASPLFYVSPKSAPMAITQGTQDPTVLPVNATELQAALQDHGVPHQLILYDGGHVFEGLSRARESGIIGETIRWAIANYAPVDEPDIRPDAGRVADSRENGGGQ